MGHGAVRVLLFGSQVTGAATGNSDVDIMVELDTGRGLLVLIAIKQDVEQATGLSADVVTPRSISPYLRDRIMREAMPA